MNSRKRLAAAKARLQSFDDDEEEYSSGPLGKSTVVEKKSQKVWNKVIAACGSNAFNQACITELMSPSLKIAQNINGTSIDCIAAGSTMTAAVCDGSLHVWGSGLPCGQLRIPTLVQIKNVTQISCGQSHIGVISDGKAYSWGSGENGVLGHGGKTAVSNPKLIEGLSTLTAVSISCGAFHTAVVAGDPRDITYVRLPRPKIPSMSPENSAIGGSSSGDSIVDKWRQREIDEQSNEFLICADLYTFGLAKAGQLGNYPTGSSTSRGGMMSPRPQLVSYFKENGFRVAKVSCGMHHTLALAVPVHAIRVFQTQVFAFGWGEHGACVI